MAIWDPARRRWEEEVYALYKLLAIWSAPRRGNEEEFEKHYAEVHLPAAGAVPGLRRLVATRTADGLDGSESAFFRVAEMHFDSADVLQESERTQEWAAMRADAGHMVERFGSSLQVGLGAPVDSDLPS